MKEIQGGEEIQPGRPCLQSVSVCVWWGRVPEVFPGPCLGRQTWKSQWSWGGANQGRSGEGDCSRGPRVLAFTLLRLLPSDLWLGQWLIQSKLLVLTLECTHPPRPHGRALHTQRSINLGERGQFTQGRPHTWTSSNIYI